MSDAEDLRKAKVLLLAAFHALRSYQSGNDSTELAREVADAIEFQQDVWKRKQANK